MLDQRNIIDGSFPAGLVLSGELLESQGTVIPALFSLRMWKDGAEAVGFDGLRLQVFQFIADRLSSPDMGKIIPLQPDAMLTLVQADGLSDERFDSLCREITDYAGQFCYCSVVCYVGQRCKSADVAEQIRSLTRADRENVLTEEGVFRYEDIPAPLEQLPTLRDENWMFFFFENRRDEMIRCVREYFQDAVDSHIMSRTFLQYFQQDFLQEIYHALKREGIPAHELYSSAYSVDDLVEPARSIAATLEWVRKMTERAAAVLNVREGGMTIAERVCRCIRTKLDQPMSRAELAELLHLSEGHIAREFKNEMGMSISQYRTNMRMEMARQMLLETSLPLSTIAQRTGYGDYAYFYSTFRKHFGISPSQIRDEAGIPNKDA